MHKVLVVENSPREAARFQSLLEKQGLAAIICLSGFEADSFINDNLDNFSAVLILWEISGPPFCFDLLLKCKNILPSLPVVVISSTLDISLAARAYALGARDFLEKPVDAERLKSCLQNLLAEQNNWSPLIEKMQEKIIGESASLMKVLTQISRVAPRNDLRVVLIGESGTGKELLAKSIHDFSSRAKNPWVAVNVSEIPATLIETAFFGHERGAFTNATAQHQGFLEESGNGTLFLDEIGDLEISLQVKLLRVIQENEFRRVGGVKTLPFNARLVCATNRDLAVDVNNGTFRRDLYHRIAEVIIQIPPLKERKGDIELLLKYFLNKHKGERPVKFARETLTILRSYSFPGNIRELDNIVKSAITSCEGEQILPQHLPLESMGTFLNVEKPIAADNEKETSLENFSADNGKHVFRNLFMELENVLPDNWLDLPYKEATGLNEKAFDRVYLPYLLKRCNHNITKASLTAGIDTKTFRKRWKDCGLPPLTAGGDESNA
jgi:two-component system NtrC family response regulator